MKSSIRIYEIKSEYIKYLSNYQKHIFTQADRKDTRKYIGIIFEVKGVKYFAPLSFSFIAALSPDKLQMVKLYPEGNAEARFKINGVKKILFYCNRDGMFLINVVKGIDDKRTAYDDIEERRELEQAAKMLFG